MKRSLYSHILRHIQAVIWFLVFTGGGIVAGGEELQRYEFSQVHMGVPLSISVYAPDEALANKGAEAAFQRVEELDALLSDYKIDSELNQLSLEKPHGIPHEVSQDLFCVLNAAKMVSDQSDGAFDVTVGPIVKLWRKARRQKKLPETEELKARLGAVDYRLIRLDQKGQKVTLTRPGMRLDLGGIAKGYAADQALLVLKSHGLSQVLLDFGGDLVVGDPPPGKDFWTIAVAPLKREEGRENYQFIDLKNGSVATSGDAFQYVEIADVRYSHIVSPHTGLGLTDRSSVTIIAPSGMQADAWASAVSVLGPKRGLEKINQHAKLDGFIITEDTTVSSNGWEKYLHSNLKKSVSRNVSQQQGTKP